MITSRRIEESDRAKVEESLARDKFHPNTKADVFFPKQADGNPDPRFVTNIYEDAEGPLMVVRGSRALRIELIFIDNAEFARNKEALIAGWQAMIEGAKRAGFTEIVASTNSPMLRRFAKRAFGFVETNVDGEVEIKKVL